MLRLVCNTGEAELCFDLPFLASVFREFLLLRISVGTSMFSLLATVARSMTTFIAGDIVNSGEVAYCKYREHKSHRPRLRGETRGCTSYLRAEAKPSQCP